MTTAKQAWYQRRMVSEDRPWIPLREIERAKTMLWKRIPKPC